ncbi:Kinesin-like protein kif15, partial [Nowakowskiella sp. JEL0078]
MLREYTKSTSPIPPISNSNGHPHKEETIKTFVRIRPWNARERALGGASSVLSLDSVKNQVLIADHSFVFDHIGDDEFTQEQVFNSVGKEICDHALVGYNATIFAYGQTGTGKTYTMQGPIETSDISLNSETRGVVQRAIEYIFEKKNSSDPGLQWTIKISSYVEIYNEQIFDLLDTNSSPCTLREDIKRGCVQVCGASERNINSPDEALKYLALGVKNRTTFSTDMNRENLNFKQGGLISESRLSLVDLAGSERQKSTSTTGDRLREGGHINKSLLALSHCINALVDISNGKPRHVHYRDSRLTYLLKDSLGGNAKACMIATVSPSAASMGETMSTLRFASRAQLIKNKATLNQSDEKDLSQ